MERSVNKAESFREVAYTLHRGVNLYGVFGSSQQERGLNTDGGFGWGAENWRFRKLDMPIIDGNDPDGWVLRLDRYFDFYKLSEEEKLEAVVLALEGDVLKWFQRENKGTRFDVR